MATNPEISKIRNLNRTVTSGTLTDGEYLAVDKIGSNTGKMAVEEFAEWNLGKIKTLPATTSFRTGDNIVVDGTNGLAKMAKDDLLEISNAPVIQMAKPVHYSTIKYGCYYATNFSVAAERGDRTGTEILNYKVGQYIRILPIAGYLVDIEQSDVLGPTSDGVITGWLNSATLVKVVRQYQSIVVKKLDETDFTLAERADVSSKIVLEVVDTEAVNSNSGKLPTSAAVHDTVISAICNTVPLLPLLKQGTTYLTNSSGSDSYYYDNNDYRCFMPCDAVAPYDLYLTPIFGYKFWAYGTYGISSTEPLHNLFNTQVHYGQVACIPKGTHYRIVVATDPENTEIGNPNTWRSVVRVVSNIGLRCDLNSAIAMDGTGNLNLAMELGDLDPNAFQRRYSYFRAITVGIQLALTDMFISIKSGYKFVGYKFDANDTPLGFIWDNPREIHHGTIVKIEKGTRYRLMIMKDPEYQDTPADVIEFSKQLVVSSSMLAEVRALESAIHLGNVSAFDIYGVSNERRRCSPHLIFGGMPLLYEGMQSIAVDRDSRVFYILRGNAGSEVYKYDLYGNRLDTITTKGNTGHDNDACYINGKIYIAGASSNTSNKLYVWDIAAGTTTELDVTSIPNNPNGSHRVLYGVCQKDNNSLYLVCIDLDPNDELNVKNDDVISVYTYNISSGNISLVTTFHRDIVYIQGCTYVNGLLYISGNIMTTVSPSNYDGTSIKIVDMSDNSILNEIKFSGSFENEGLDFYEAYGSTHLITCFALYHTRADICSFIPNW